MAAEIFSSSFYLEDRRFQKLVGNDAIRDICWRIAGCSWFIWRELYAAMHKVSKAHRVQVWKFLRVSQKERARYERSEDRLAGWRDRHTRRYDYTRPGFFEMSINPFAYQVGVYPMYLGKGKIGVTLNCERVRGNRVRVYYKSDMKFPLDIQRIEKNFRDRELWESLGQTPLIQPIYHMKIRKSVAA